MSDTDRQMGLSYGKIIFQKENGFAHRHMDIPQEMHVPKGGDRPLDAFLGNVRLKPEISLPASGFARRLIPKFISLINLFGLTAAFNVFPGNLIK